MSPMRRPTLHVAKGGEETWKVRYRDAGGHQTSETFHGRRAQQEAKEFSRWMSDYGVDQALELLATRDGERRGYTVAEWCEYHIDALSGVQADTLTRYRGYVANDLGDFGRLPLDGVTHEAVSAWVNKLAKTTNPRTGKPTSGKTIKNKHGFLSAAFARAVTKGLIASNPCKGTRLPRTEQEPMTFLTHEEYLDLLGCFTMHWQPLVTFLFSTGLRWGEATALRVGDVDLERGTVTVTRAWKRDRTIGPPKSRKSRRTVALSPEVVDVLEPLVGKRPADAWLFINQQGGPVRHATFHDNAWLPAVRLANGEDAQKAGAKRVARRRDGEGKIIAPLGSPIGKRPRIHDARHSNASWLLAAGVPINYVQAHLGHESITTTVDRYGHVMPAAQVAIRSAISGALAAAHPQIEA